MNEALIGLLGALFGGIGIKIVEGYILPRAKQEDVAKQIRDELREEIKGYKDEVRGLRNEVDEWRRKYFQLIEILLKANVDIPDHLIQPYVSDPNTPDLKK